MAMEKFVHQRNLAHYRKLDGTRTQREQILTLFGRGRDEGNHNRPDRCRPPLLDIYYPPFGRWIAS
jgi:CBS domain-containing protein